jgi:anti-sigma-K factor RskA
MTPEERDALAGEYVLGTLEAGAAREVERALAGDAELRGAVAWWEAAFAPLTSFAPEEAPPPDLWARIEAALPGARAAPQRQGFERWRFDHWRPNPWRWLALGSSAVAAGLAALLLLRPAPEAPLMTVLLTNRDQPAWLVEADRGGALRLAAVNRQPVPPDRVMQLWALPQGATAPTSLGLIAPEAGQYSVSTTAIRPSPGMLIEITLEPPGGSPTGRPTGQILFIGRLSAASGS